MKVNDPNLSTTGAAGAAHANETAQANAARRAASAAHGAHAGAGAPATSSDDVHLSELVRSLRSLASDSPERQAKIEHLTRAYAAGSYKVDAEATASAIIKESASKASAGGGPAGGTVKS